MQPFFIVGHTTSQSTIIWLGGTSRFRSAIVTLRERGSAAEVASRSVMLNARSDFTEKLVFDPLDPDTPYEVEVRFRRTRPLLWRLGVRPSWNDQYRFGRLRTFPAGESSEPFSFLHGSCNLSTVTLTHLGGLAAGGLGMLMGRASLERDSSFYDWGWLQWAHTPLRKLLSVLLPLGAKLVYVVTKFELPKPMLPSPFEPLLLERKRTDGEATAADAEPEEEPPAFAIHAGDQIYFDFPFPGREPTEKNYRRAYRAAWSEDEHMRKFLAQCPQYMTLDDHEIVDQFARDSIPDWAARRTSRSWWKPAQVRTPDTFLEAATAAYSDFVDERHPSAEGRLDYEFDHGAARFFVLDTRSERLRYGGQMIDPEQMTRLKEWLVEKPGALHFVVSSVPFVAHLRLPPQATGKGNGAAPSLDRPSGPDKWTCEPYREQRDQIVEHIYEHGVGRVVFLVGDMHCTYHASMRVGPPARRITVHEIASGPIHQLQFADRADFIPQIRSATTANGKIPFTTTMGFLHGATGNMVRVTADPEKSRVGWQVIPTSEPTGRPGKVSNPDGSTSSDDEASLVDERGLPLRGTIHLGACP